MDLQELKSIDAALVKGGYSDDTLASILPAVNGYVRLAEQLRALPLGEVPPVTHLYGGKRS